MSEENQAIKEKKSPDDGMKQSSASKSSESDPLVGKVLFKRYSVGSVMGRTDLATRYLAKNIENRQLVTIKNLNYLQSDITDLFEACCTDNPVDHKTFTKTIECISSDLGRPALISEFAEAINLYQLMETIDFVDSPDEFVNVIYQMCDGLEHLHSANRVHGNLKPSNVLLQIEGNSVNVKLDDCNQYPVRQAIKEKQGPIDEHDHAYFSPEHCQNKNLVAQSDVYQLGLIAHFLLTGKQPYVCDSPGDYIHAHTSKNEKPDPVADSQPGLHCVEDLDQFLQEAIDPDLDWRVQSIEDFRNGIREWYEAEDKSIELNEELSVDEMIQASKDRKSGVKKKGKRSISKTVSDLVALRRHQVEQDNTIMMQFTESVSAKGPRQSPRATMFRLVYLASSIVLFICAAIYVYLNYSTEVKDGWNATSRNLSSMVFKSQDEEIEPHERAATALPVAPPSSTRQERVAKQPLQAAPKARSSRKPPRRISAKEYYSSRGSGFANNMASSKTNRLIIDYKMFNEDWLK